MDRFEEERIRMETDMLLDKYFPWWRKELLKYSIYSVITFIIGVGILVLMRYLGIE